MKHKYIILDFENILAYHKTGYWNITEKFKELIDTDKLDKVKLEKNKNKI